MDEIFTKKEKDPYENCPQFPSKTGISAVCLFPGKTGISEPSTIPGKTGISALYSTNKWIW